MLRFLRFSWVLCIALSALADDTVERARRAVYYTVKVESKTANVFHPRVMKGHGSGIVFSRTESEGLVFTNLHVVAADPLDAQEINLQFSVSSGAPESVLGDVIYRSPTIDLAVVRFDPRKLQRAGAHMLVARLSQHKDFVKAYPEGTRVMAVGSPLSSQKAVTTGEVSAIHHDFNYGLFIQTTAPINPGNSGGPLIDEKEEVIGMNTKKMTGADNTGFATPMAYILKDYLAWKRRRSLAQGRNILARFSLLDKEELDVEGTSAILEREVPGFFDMHQGILVVTEAAPSTGLRAGDLILKIGDECIGSDGYKLDQKIHEGSDELRMEVIRGRRKLALDVPVVALGRAQQALQYNFLMVGGVIFQELTPDRSWALTSNRSRVFVGQILPTSPVRERGLLLPGSVINSVTVGGRNYPVARLAQLTHALRKVKTGETARLFFQSPVNFDSDDGSTTFIRDAQFGGVKLASDVQTTLLGVDWVITPRELPLRVMKRGLDFSGKDPRTFHWQHFLSDAGRRCMAAEAELGLAEAEEL